MPVVNDYTALLSGSYWGGIEVTSRPAIVTFSFPTSAPAYDASIGGFTAATVSSFQAFSAGEQADALAALAEWAAACNIVFVQVAPGQGDINFQKVDLDTTSGPSYAGAGGIGFYPFGDWNFFTYPSFANDLDSSGDVFMNTQVPFVYGTLLHEIGHALGLKHPTEVVTDFAANPVVTHDQVLSADDPNLTIMATVGGGTGHLHTFDQQAVAAIYGAQVAGTPDVVTASISATYTLAQNAFVSSWSWNAATETMTQTGRGTNDTIRGTSVQDVINGGKGNDELFGLAGADTLNGGAGNDTLHGGGGADRMVGSTGDDTYYVDDAGDVVVEGATGGTYDVVRASVTYTLARNVEGLELYGTGLTGIGNSLGNAIFCDSAATIYGMNGNDYIVGSLGADTIHGGNDDDFIYADYLGFGISGGDRLYGDAGADQLFGSGGNDIINGGTGNDTLQGNGGMDALAGGTGDDVFVFQAVSDSGTTSTTRDTITDFQESALPATEADKIDLAAIDADAVAGGDQAFSFIGTGPFTAASVGDTAGQVRFQVIGGKTYVYVDVDRDQSADMTIRLTGNHSGLAAGDFNL